ncbi:MAG: Radical domain protein [Thermomicrobiales bacterium]|nr:Radical domain protein [Thermomicrobiales bacterium]
MALVLPGLTDGEEAIAAVAKAARENGASPSEAGALRLAPLVREHYLGFVAATLPELLARYERAYARTNIASDYQAAIERRLARVRQRQGFVTDAMQGRWNDAPTSVRRAGPMIFDPGSCRSRCRSICYRMNYAGPLVR